MTRVDEMLDLNTIHIHTDELPWVVDAAGGSYRLLQAKKEDHLVVTNFRTPPGAISPAHKHLGPVMIYTISGTWGHRPDVMDHRTGTYVYEPVGALHRYFGGPGVVECVGLSFGDTENYSDDGEVAGYATFDGKVQRYFELCEEQGFARPNLLT